MKKIFGVMIIIAMVSAVYLILMVSMGAITDIVETANATMTASSNLSNYPGASEGLVAAPWIMWFVPGGIGIAVIIVYLRAS